MKIADVLPELTILPLRRFADAWGVVAIKSDKRDVFEQAILSEIGRIDTEQAVRGRLVGFERDLDHIRRGNAERTLRLLAEEPGYAVADDIELIKRLAAADAAFHEYALGSTALRHLDARNVDVYQSVLQIAWEDKVSFDEYQLLSRLQRKLNIGRRDQRVIEIRTQPLTPLTPQEAEQSLRDLSSYGFVCQFKMRGHTHVVVPEEIAAKLRSIYSITLQPSAYRHLATRLPVAVVKECLEQAGQPSVSSRRDFLIDRLIDGDVSPSALLDRLDNAALDELLASVSAQKPPSMRAVKIRHIISHFDRLVAKPGESAPDGDPDKTYYDYLVDLAARHYDVLRAANVIQQDQNVDRAFERGVRYAFSKFLGHPAIQFTGNAHADGGVAAAKGRMVLWDCKSALQHYALTEPKAAQFLQYVAKEAPNIVCPFLVISGDFTAESEHGALALKMNCPPGTEIGLLTAANLRWLADAWNRDYPDKRLPLDVLAHSGFLNQDILELRLRLFSAQAQSR